MNNKILHRNISVELNPVALRARYRIFEFLKEESKNSNYFFKKIPFRNKESSYKYFHDNYKLINKLEKKSFFELYKNEKTCSEKVHEIYSKIENKYNKKNNYISRNFSVIHFPKINKLNSKSFKIEKKEIKTNISNLKSNKTIFQSIEEKKKEKKKKNRKYSMDDSKKVKNVKIKGLFGKDINNNFKITPNGGIIYKNSIWRTKNINTLIKYQQGVFLKQQKKKN